MHSISSGSTWSRRHRALLVVILAGVLIPLLSAVSPRPAVALATQLKRYPYLTDVVGPYATINWGTDRSATTGSVKYGKVGAESCTANTATATKTSITVGTSSQYQWKAMLTLTPGTEYCYRVYLGGTDLLGADPSPRFRTQVPAGSTEAYSFAVLGDWGYVGSSGSNPDQANLMKQIAASGVRFALATGDMAYSSGSQTSYGDLVQTGSSTSTIFGSEYWKAPGASIPMFPTAGNHGFNSTFLLNWPQDRAVSSSGGRYAMETQCCLNGTTSASYPSAWYAFDAGGARFYVLEAAWSESNVGTGTQYKNDYDHHWTPSSAQYQWLENDLKTHPSALKFAFFHYPLYSDQLSQNSDTFLQGTASLEGLLGRYGVDIAFNGHAHIYQRNLKPNAGGLISYVTGGGGASLASIGGKGCSATDAYGIGWSGTNNAGNACGSAPKPTSITQVYHFIKVSVSGTQVTVAPTDEMGRTFDVQTYTFPSEGGPTTGTISGTVTDAGTGAAVGGATVGYSGGSAVADASGRYTLAGVAPGTHSVTAAAAGYGGQSASVAVTTGATATQNFALSATTPSTTTLRFAPNADARVEELNPSTNYGASTTLRTDGSSDPDVQSYLRFAVSGVTGTVQSAKLRLYVTNGSANGPAVYAAANTTWSETSLTWANRPGPAGAASDNKAAIAASAWVEYDVKPLLTGDGTYSFALVPESSDGLDMHSREGVNKPELVLTVGG